jgi:hypothetical protein
MEQEKLLNEVLKEAQRTRKDMEDVKRLIMSIPPWISASDIAKDRGMQTQSVIKQVTSKNFEPAVDFKFIGNKMYLARSAVYRIQRIRNARK